jgi:predicted PurR-regulated permease PerM
MQKLMQDSGSAQTAAPPGFPVMSTPGLMPQAPEKPAPAQTVTVSQGSGVGMSVLAGTRSFLGEAMTLLVVLFFLLADGDALLRRFIEILPGLPEKKRAVQIATEVERNISSYLATITMMNLFVGIANGISIWAFGLPDPLLWGTVALLLARRFTLNPLLVIAALMFWDWLWGVAGALLAVPLLAVVKILCDNIEVLTPLGHMLGAEPSRRKAK